MNKKKFSGSYYTPPVLAEFIMSHLLPTLEANSDLSILEPSVGDGAFIRAFNSRNYPKHFSQIRFTAVEKDIDELAKARIESKHRLKANVNFRFNGQNFLDWQTTVKSKYSLIIGNPPYIKKSLLHEDHVTACESIHQKAGVGKSIKNIWTAFLLGSIPLLKEDGIIAFVLPAELLQSNFTTSIRKLLVAQFQKVEIFTFNDLQFDSIGQDTVLLIAYKRSQFSGTYYSNIDSPEQLQNLNFTLSKNDLIQETNTKWTHHILDSDEIQLLDSLKRRFSRTSDFCDSRPGIVTAANKFFIVNAETEKKYNLSEFTQPIIQKGFFVNGKAEFDKDDQDQLISSGRPCKFLNFTEASSSEDLQHISEYLQLGIKEDIPSRYKCLQRKKWFVVPNIPKASDGFFFKRCHHYPKLLKNEAKILVTDSAYQIDMKAGYNIEDLVYSYYNSLTLAFCELDGRYYGGGVLELTPKEFKTLPLPFVTIEKKSFALFKEKFKKKACIEDVLVDNDQKILGQTFGLDEETIKKIQNIKKKLTAKRLRQH